MVSITESDVANRPETGCIYCLYPSTTLIRNESEVSTRASRLFDVLHSAVSLQTTASLLPGELALDNVIDNGNDLVGWPNVLLRAVSLSQSTGGVLDT